MQLNDQAKGIVVFWGGLHLIGLLMFFDKNTSSQNPIYVFIKYLWIAELSLLAVFIFILMSISVKDLCQKKNSHAHLAEDGNTSADKSIHIDPQPNLPSKPDPPPKSSEPTQQDLKQKAILQILSERSFDDSNSKKG